MAEKMTLERHAEKIRRIAEHMAKDGFGGWADSCVQAADAVYAHIAQPAQAVDVGAGSAHKNECPVKMARAICEAIIKHQFQDEHRHGRLTLDVETFLHEFNAARDSGATRAIGNVQEDD